MYVVTKTGKKLPVDDSSVDWDKDKILGMQTVGLYTEDVVLKDIWVVTLFRNQKFMNSFKGNLNDWREFVAEIEYDHEPSHEEIMHAMTTHGLGRSDLAQVDKCLTMDFDY